MRRTLAGTALYLVAAATAGWAPTVGLAIAVALPVFRGVTSEGWAEPCR